ncbi:kazal-type serine peptidase inhibitor domain 3 [Hoplias malabaricus]|uniref:kazal-type serine peptidase inhibitor domain 3 n=1 Tax=Hoplias malabaricus TaxID=27720 RepID=UPI00346213C8
MSWPCLVWSLLLSAGLAYALPHYTYEDMDEDLALSFDYYKDVDAGDYRNGTECEECVPELCPETRGCRAGLVRDGCGCCLECGNLEGQSCDLGDRNILYGVCGEDLECKLDFAADRNQDVDGDGDGDEDGAVPEAQCVCVSQEPLCGSDGKTYMNLCKLKEAAFLSPGLNGSAGPCRTVPVIKVPPRSVVNETGSSVVFLCEVFAFPMALVEWKKDGKDVILPGDDPHVSVQTRGGPQKYELSSWLQIEEAGRLDSGTYRCVARNDLGNVSASAVLGILPPDEMTVYMEETVKGLTGYDQMTFDDGDYY